MPATSVRVPKPWEEQCAAVAWTTPPRSATASPLRRLRPVSIAVKSQFVLRLLPVIKKLPLKGMYNQVMFYT